MIALYYDEVSPGLRSRPSLSEPRLGQPRRRTRVSPGLRSRPSLSVPGEERDRAVLRRGVAGTTVPAFVERAKRSTRIGSHTGSVAGTTVPAFVERTSSTAASPSCAPRVSPGLRSRPSLSACKDHLVTRFSGRVSPGLRSRPSLSVPIPSAHHLRALACRRDYGPGLR